MMRAMLEQRMPELVLREEFDLTRAINFCLEVVGIGISSPERQSAASRALVALCTDRKLRPAVDNVLVLRRLCRIIELTESDTALAAAAGALFAVADDDAWQIKGGAVAEVLREACLRCIASLKNMAKGRGSTSEVAAASSGAAAGAAGTAGATAAPAVPAAVAAAPSGAESQESAQRSTGALLAAAAGVLKPAALKLLSPDELVDATGAIAVCLAKTGDGGGSGGGVAAAAVNGGASGSDGGGSDGGGSGGGGSGGGGSRSTGGADADATSKLLAALEVALQQAGSIRSMGAHADAVAGADGAVAVLVREITRGTTLKQTSSAGVGGSGGGDASGNGGSDAGHGAADDAAGAAAAASSVGSDIKIEGGGVDPTAPVQRAAAAAADSSQLIELKPAGRSAFSCLATVLEYSGRFPENPAAAADAAATNGADAALLPLVQLPAAADTARAMRSLLAISGYCTRHQAAQHHRHQQQNQQHQQQPAGGCVVAAALEALPSEAQRRELVGAVLRSASSPLILACSDDGFVSEALLGLAAALLGCDHGGDGGGGSGGGGLLSASQLQAAAPALVEAAVGVVLGEWPADSWRTFAGQPVLEGSGSGGCGSGRGGNPRADAVSHPAGHQAAAAPMVRELLEWAAVDGRDLAEYDARLPVNRIAGGLVKDLIKQHQQPQAAAGNAAAVEGGGRGGESTDAAAAARRAKFECLTLGLQLAASEGVWRSYSCSDLERAANCLESLLASKDSVALSLAAVGVVSLWAAVADATRGNGGDHRSLWKALLALLTRVLRLAADAGLKLEETRGEGGCGEGESTKRRRLAIVAGAVNVAVACLAPGNAEVGGGGRQLQPWLRRELLTQLQSTGSERESLVELYTSWRQGGLLIPRADAASSKASPTTSISQLTRASFVPSSSHWRTGAKLSVQLKWHFEAAPKPVGVDTVCWAFHLGQPEAYGRHYATVASSTVRPLAAALGAAVERLNLLAGWALRDVSGPLGGGGGAAAPASVAPAEVLALLSVALRVAASGAAVLAACVPPGYNDTD